MGDTFIANQGEDVFVEYFAFTVSQLLEPGKSRIDIGFAFHHNAQILQTLLERIAATELAQNDFVGAPSHIFSPHDFISVTGLEYPVLMDA